MVRLYALCALWLCSRRMGRQERNDSRCQEAPGSLGLGKSEKEMRIERCRYKAEFVSWSIHGPIRVPEGYFGRFRQPSVPPSFNQLRQKWELSPQRPRRATSQNGTWTKPPARPRSNGVWEMARLLATSDRPLSTVANCCQSGALYGCPKNLIGFLRDIGKISKWQ